MRFAILAACLLAGGTLASFGEDPATVSPITVRAGATTMERRLKAMQVAFRATDVTVSEAVASLESHSGGVNFTAPDAAELPRVTLLLGRDTTLYAAIAHLCRQTGMAARVDAAAVVFERPTTAHFCSGAAGLLALKPLREKGLRVRFDEREQELVVSGPGPVVAAAARMLYAGHVREMSGPATGLIELAHALHVDPEVAAMKQKLQAIVIPKVAFKNTPVAEVVQYLKRRSTALDPEGEGVDIVLRRAQPRDEQGALPTAGGALDEPGGLGFDDAGEAAQPVAETAGETITMQFEDIPLGELLRYTASAAGLKLHVEPAYVVLADPDVPLEPMAERFFRLPHHLQKKQSWLDLGITFPKSSSVVRKGELMLVRNTPTNLRAMGRWLCELRRTERAKAQPRVDPKQGQ